MGCRLARWRSEGPIGRRGAPRSWLLELPADRLERYPARVLGGRPQDHDLGRDALEQPTQILVGETRIGVFVRGDDDPVEVLLLDQFAQGSPDLLRYVGLVGKGKLATVINTS